MEICYLLAFPDSEPEARLPKEKIRGLKDAPYFQPVDIEVTMLGEETVQIDKYVVSMLRQRYDGRVQMVEARYRLPDPFAASVLPDRTKLQGELQSRYLPEAICLNGLFEEYSVLLVQDTKLPPDRWIEKTASPSQISFVRSGAHSSGLGGCGHYRSKIRF